MLLRSLHPLSLILSLFLFILFSITLLQLRRLRLRRNNSTHHGPPTYPLIGCLISFYANRKSLLHWYTHLLSHSPTNTILVHRLGAPRTIITANPQNVEYILKTNFLNFPKGKPFTDILGDFLGHGIFNVDGELWRTQRKLAAHEFTGRSLREFVIHTLEEEVGQRLLPVMEALCIKQQMVDLQELLARFSLNVICKITLGVDICCLDPSVPASPLARAFDEASEISARRGTAPLFVIWKVKRWVGAGSERRLKEAVGEVRRRVMGMIRERKNMRMRKIMNHGREDLLSRLICQGYEENMIRDMLISFMMAGRDTTSAALTWFFWLLSQHPEVEEQVVRETQVRVEGELEYESLKKLKFLKACLCESMRLYPPVPWDSKHAIVDDLLPDGTVVKAGDRVTYFPYGMGRMEALWGKDRLEFRPDRWFVERDSVQRTMTKVSPFKFPIFQAGPRVCLGKDMAFIQMKYVAFSILRRFRIRHISPDQPLFVPLLTAHMAGGFNVLICKRKKETDR
ncbi:cytochrome P450 94B3-like [Prosopis cineraria]|uniref:cytochrome P450 94B3-like n=1 Tax=Prosopis cineraria TaxID=364024 RepID=UPI00240F5045|nr:cytochrome P450 94B3-like [Prosopis cineraria]